MNKMPNSEIVVLDVAGTRAIVKVDNSVNVSRLTALGFVFADHIGERKISDMSDRAWIVKELIALSAVFSGGRDWSPAEVVDFLRDQGWLNAKFRRIEWVGSDKYIISEI